MLLQQVAGHVVKRRRLFAISILCCIRLHNFCVDRRLELEDHLGTESGDLEIQPGVRMAAAALDSNRAPVANLDRRCTCPAYPGGMRDTTPPNSARCQQGGSSSRCWPR